MPSTSSGSAKELTIRSSIQWASVAGTIRHDHRESIAADARGRRGFSGRARQAVREFFEELVARTSRPKVSLTVLKRCRSMIMTREFALLGAREIHGLRQAVEEQLTVGEAGQRVVVGHVGQALFFSDVVERERDIAPTDPSAA